MEYAQAFFLALSKTKSEMLAEIAVVKAALEFLFVGNQILEVREVLVAQCAQPIRDRFWLDNFRSHKPERINKWKLRHALPFFSQIPVLISGAKFLAKSNRVITYEEPGATAFERRKQVGGNLDTPKTLSSLSY